jgi:2-polyprenyl-6-methoxyphenol hydroxylase-like FAD-dependent oxidoreductase
MNRIQIVGGGLAGLTLGIALRQKGVPVTVLEAGRYPRHRVCGEFVSGRGREVLRELGLEEKLRACGAREAQTAAFYTPDGAECIRPLPRPALCLPRFTLDDCLATEFRQLGGELAQNERWRGSFGPGAVRATGRRAVSTSDGWRWFALKVHARGAALAADLEMHLFDNGYVGLCRLSGGLVNVCGLFRSRVPMTDLAASWPQLLRGHANSPLNQRLRDAEFLPESFCATAGLELRSRRAAGRSECSLGDAITMIAPMTGNGMSMAFESARLASDPMLEYCRDRISWVEAVSRTARSCDRAFRRRLFWASCLQRVAFQRLFRLGAVKAGAISPALWRALFWRTR